MPRVFLSPEDRSSNTYASTALWNGHTTNEKEQMARCADYLEAALLRCGFEVRNAQYGGMYDRVRDSNSWPADLHVALHTNGFNGKAAGTRVHCYPSEKSRAIGRLIQDRIAPMSPGSPDKMVESYLYELRAPTMPAVLPEFGFHDNEVEAQWLIDNMEAIAEETCKAICEFFAVPYVSSGKPTDIPPEPVDDPEEEPEYTTLYRVQVGAFKVKANAEACLDEVRKVFPGAYITEARE